MAENVYLSESDMEQMLQHPALKQGHLVEPSAGGQLIPRLVSTLGDWRACSLTRGSRFVLWRLPRWM
jgi:hypothetical protein